MDAKSPKNLNLENFLPMHYSIISIKIAFNIINTMFNYISLIAQIKVSVSLIVDF